MVANTMFFFLGGGVGPTTLNPKTLNPETLKP